MNLNGEPRPGLACLLLSATAFLAKKLVFLCALLVLFVPFPLRASPPGNAADWTMTFSDEFNGTALDTSKWAMTLSPGWQDEGSASSWWDTTGAYHVVSNGTLKLVCKKVQEEDGHPYTCAVISGHNAFNQMYGYFEASMKLPAGGTGMWPAFWMIAKSSDNSWMWPPEIDIMEAKGGQPTVNYMTNHVASSYPYPCSAETNGNSDNGGPVTCGDHYTSFTYSGPNFTAAFHTFSVLWTPTAVTWYIDGVQRAEMDYDAPIAGYGFPGMYMILANATADGTGWEPAPTSATVFPNQLEVDYVRVYASNAAPPAISAISVSVAPTSATITWTTDQSSTSQVVYGPTASYGSSSTLNATMTTSHSVTLSGLTPSTTYHFAVQSASAAGALATSPDGTFSTSTAPITYTITASAGTGGKISPSGKTVVNRGASLKYTITPNSGYAISNVLVDGTSVGAVSSYTFGNITSNHTISATFTAVRYTLTITKNGTGTGSVSTYPSGTSFIPGTLVTLTAIPGYRSTFGGWSGACSGLSTSCRLTMNGNKSVNAKFNAR